MGPPRKRQKLEERAKDLPVVESIEPAEEYPLDHSKTALPGLTQMADKSQSTLFIRSLPPHTTNENLAEHLSQSFPIKHAVAVIDRVTNKCKGYGFVTFADHEDAKRALEELDGSEFEGSKIKITFAERRQREDGEGQETKKHYGPPRREGEDEPMSSKLIIRNLPWSVSTPEKLTRLFLSFGKVNDAIVPKDSRGLMRGFGIVLLRGRKNAETALQKMNGKEIDGRILAVDWAVDKDTWKKAQDEAKAEAEAEAGPEVEEEVSNVEQAFEDGTDGSFGQSDDFPVLGAEDEISNEEDVDIERDDTNTEKPAKITNNESTLFIRNLPFMATDLDVQEHFEAFAPVRYARVVLDPTTERPRGTGFVCFRKIEDADNCLKGAPHLTKFKDAAAKNEPTAPSILENELADPSGLYTMDGRVLQITRAVDKSEATRLTAEGAASRYKRDRDKRRLYLLSEGTIASNSPLYQKLSPSEIAMREASMKQRKKLIDSNPSLHLSLTRLSIRNIPRGITSKDLKTLAREAVVGFAKDAKEGKRQPLSKEELARFADDMREADKERKRKGKGLVKQAKIVFEDREGGKVQEGSGRSRGYGFVEYHTHRSALMGLRWLNGHSITYQAKEKKAKAASQEEIQDRKRRLIVEFAIENAQVVHRRKEIEAKSRGKSQSGGGDDNDEKEIVKELSLRSPALLKGKRGIVRQLRSQPLADDHIASKQWKIARKKNAKRAKQRQA